MPAPTHCARCRSPLTPENRVESFVGARYCGFCLPIVNWNLSHDPIPLPDAATLRAWDHEYKSAVMPSLPALPALPNLNSVKDNG